MCDNVCFIRKNGQNGLTKTNANDTVTVEMRHNARICAIDLRWRLVRTKEETHGCDEQQNLGKSETDSEGKETQP